MKIQIKKTVKRSAILSLLLCIGAGGSLLAQSVVTDTLVFVFSLHGQTRRYQTTFEEQQDTLYMHWGIERNTKWQSGSYAMSRASVERAIRLSFLQPEDGKHVSLPAEETVGILSQAAYRQLKERQALVYNQTHYSALPTDEKALGYPLIHVKDSVEGCEMWIVDHPCFPLVWKIRNNPLEINWTIQKM